jgi:hypothetical protein
MALPFTLAACDTTSSPDAYDRSCALDSDCIEAFYDACGTCPDGAINASDKEEMLADRGEHRRRCVKLFPTVGACADEIASCEAGTCELVPDPQLPDEGENEGDGQ